MNPTPLKLYLQERRVELSLKVAQSFIRQAKLGSRGAFGGSVVFRYGVVIVVGVGVVVEFAFGFNADLSNFLSLFDSSSDLNSYA